MKTKVTIKEDVKLCDCCGKNNLKRALLIEFDNKIYLGVTCAGKRFDLNLSGNPYEAAKRLEFHINTNLSEDELIEIIEEVENDHLNI